MDDFFLRPEQRTPERYAQPGGNIDHERFREEVLLPLSRNEPVQYRKFDCSTFTLSDATPMPGKSINIVEGAYSMHPRLEKFYDYSVFLKIDPQTQRQRIEKRNGAYAQQFFEKWIPLENSYFSETETESRCDLVLDISLQSQSCAAKY
jgi:uridine kinase